MNKKFKVILFSIAVIGIVGFTGFNYVMHGGARNLSDEKASFVVSSKAISSEFASNVELANKKYLEKAIIIKGTVTRITDKEVILDNSIICNLKDLDATIKKDQMITLKGRVVGYDDLMGELKIDQCLKAY